MRRLGNAACEVLIAWPLVTCIWVADKIAGRVIDARICRLANQTNEDD